MDELNNRPLKENKKLTSAKYFLNFLERFTPIQRIVGVCSWLNPSVLKSILNNVTFLSFPRILRCTRTVEHPFIHVPSEPVLHSGC